MSLLNYYTKANTDTDYYALAGSGVPIPGPPGPTGPAGPVGPPGNSILSDVFPPTAAVGEVGDLYVDLVTSQLYKKTDAVTWTPEFGLIGPAGPAATVGVGTTTALPAGSAASVTNVGTATAAIFNFGIPAGAQGATGPQGEPGSAAEAALWSTFPATQPVDLNNQALSNAVLINAPLGLNLTANGGDIVLLQKGEGANISIQGGDLDLCGNDLKNVGSLTTSGAANTVELGGLVPPAAPLANFSVLSSEVGISHLNPLTQMTIRGQGDVRIESTNGDLNLIGDDVNIATTGATNILNITSLAAIQNTAGAAYNITAGGAMAVQAGGLISITTPGQINIGSGNVLGATTSIEKLDFLDSVVSKVAGAADLQFQNVVKVSNAGDVTRTLTVEATDAPLTLQGVQTNVTSLSNGNVVIAPQGTGTTRFGTGTTADVAIIDASGTMLFGPAPKCASAPVMGTDLCRKSYVDTKIAGDQNVSLLYNLAMPIANTASPGPFFYVPSAAGPPTGTPTVVPGCSPIYLDTTGGGVKLYAYTGGVWNAI